jgi:diguanylate cyclase (GGDEF)-like protein
MEISADPSAPGYLVERAIQEKAAGFLHTGPPAVVGDRGMAVSAGDKPPGGIRDILSAILAHDALPQILQKIADDFVALHPELGAAIFVLSGQNFLICAEANLPARPCRRFEVSTSSSDLREDFPELVPILETGINLAHATPLVSSSGQARGAFVVFDYKGQPLNEVALENVRSLCGLAQVAMEHGQLYEEVVYHTQFDRLTGLPNRLLLQDRLGQAILAARKQNSMVAVCSIDLDGFKQINDTLGHDIGDVVIKLISERLVSSVRDLDTLARHSGDEFILLLSCLSHQSEATTICERLLRDLSAPFVLYDRSLRFSASIGISLYPDHGDTTDLLLRNADVALRAAKDHGGKGIQLYSQSLGLETRRSQEMVGAMVNALAQTQFRIVYQPIFDTEQRIAGFEALLRWKHPWWGNISPLEFIPTAEKSGLIVAIGDWVIQDVCRQAVEWAAAGLQHPKMFVNISGVQLQHLDFSSKIASTLRQSGLPPSCLELEITESWVVSDLRAAAAGLRELRSLGIGIAIDDFGTGFASFNYLQELPFDTLKIDRSFVLQLDGSAGKLSTVRGIVTLAKQLGLKTVAEGVECEAQLRQLQAIGCDYLQGYFLSHPLEAEEACALLRQPQEQH